MQNKDKEYLALFSCCIPVKGHTQGIIMDIQRNRYYQVPNDLIDITIQLKENLFSNIYSFYKDDIDTFTEYIDFLIKNELVFWTKSPDSFPSIPLNKWFLSSITNAILEIGEIDLLSFDIPNQLSKASSKSRRPPSSQMACCRPSNC